MWNTHPSNGSPASRCRKMFMRDKLSTQQPDLIRLVGFSNCILISVPKPSSQFLTASYIPGGCISFVLSRICLLAFWVANSARHVTIDDLLEHSAILVCNLLPFSISGCSTASFSSFKWLRHLSFSNLSLKCDCPFLFLHSSHFSTIPCSFVFVAYVYHRHLIHKWRWGYIVWF